MQTANEWLENSKNIIAENIFNDVTLAEKCNISYGFPSSGGTRKVNKIIGQAWQQDGVEAIFINPSEFKEGNDIKVLGILIHEMIHIKVGTEKGHRKEFKAVMREVGLTGKATATTPGDELKERLNVLNFTPMPIIPLDKIKVKKQGTRMIKLACGCGRIMRVSQKVIDEGGITCNLCENEFLPEE